MIIPCEDCGVPKDWSIERIDQLPVLFSKCFSCDPSGPFVPEPIEIVRKPRGRASLWPAPTDVAPVDVSEI